MKATYNIVTDQLKAYFDERLSDSDYQRMRGAGFTYWHGSKCFVAKWNPQAEDLICEFGMDIEEDDRPDDVEARVDRFAKYAEEAEESAAGSQAYLESDRANTERRRTNAAKSVKTSLEKAQHWQQRIEASVRHAAFKVRPDVITRRIQGLEADLRRHKREAEKAVGFNVLWQAPSLTREKALTITNFDHISRCFPKAEFPLSDYEGDQSLWGALDKGVITFEQARDIAIKHHDEEISRASRWIAHIEDRLLYEKASLEANGALNSLTPVRKKPVQPIGIQKTRAGATPELFGAIGYRPGFTFSGPFNWALITKVNRISVECMTKQVSVGGDGQATPRYFTMKKEIYGIDALKTPDEVRIEMPELLEDWKKLQELMARKAAGPAKATA